MLSRNSLEVQFPPQSDVVGIVLAGGFGSRLKSVQPDLPKPLISCAGKPFIEWVLRYLQMSGVERFVISLGHLAEVAQSYFDAREPAGLKISTVVESSPLGTAGAVRFAWNGYQDHPVLVLNGDSLLFADYRKLFEKWRSVTADAMVVGVPQADASRYGTLTVADQDRLVSFDEKRPGPGLINAGVYLFAASLFKTIPAGVSLSLEKEIFPKWLRDGRDIRVCELSGSFLDIGIPESLAAADEFLRNNWPGGLPI